MIDKTTGNSVDVIAYEGNRSLAVVLCHKE